VNRFGRCDECDEKGSWDSFIDIFALFVGLYLLWLSATGRVKGEAVGFLIGGIAPRR
jgi:hypothetical protein